MAFREALEDIAPPDTGRVSSTANQRAQMPTTRISGPTGTAVVPSSDPANHFGVTTQMPRRSRRLPVALGFGLVLAGAAVLLLRAQRVEAPSGETSPPVATESPTPTPTPTGATATGATPTGTTVTAVAAAATVPTEIPNAAAQPTAAGATAPEAAAFAHEPELAPRAQEPAKTATVAVHATSPSKAAKKHKTEHGDRSESHAPAEAAAPAPSAPTAPAVAVAAAPTAPAAETPAQRGPREVLSEGEKLLGQGEVRDACARGEEAKRMNPKLAPTYKFLGKCYMREGKATQANDNYRKYLELAPNASDAMFIKSIIK
jgi:hypothetical protein